MTQTKPQLIQDLNAFGEQAFRKGEYAQAEERFRTALEVYKEWFKESGYGHVEVLSSITGLVRALEAQGRRSDAGQMLEDEHSTVIGVIRMLKEKL